MMNSHRHHSYVGAPQPQFVVRKSQKNMIDVIFIIIFGILSFTFAFEAAVYYRSFGKDAAQMRMQSTQKLSTSLYVAASLQALLLLVLGLRGFGIYINRGSKSLDANNAKSYSTRLEKYPYARTFAYNVFRLHVVQMVIMAHAQLPNLLITGLWAAQVVRDGMDPHVGRSTAFGPGSGVNSHLAKAYVFHTIALVFSNCYSSYVQVILFPNSEEMTVAPAEESAVAGEAS